jgi:hypothetical protein
MKTSDQLRYHFYVINDEEVRYVIPDLEIRGALANVSEFTTAPKYRVDYRCTYILNSAEESLPEPCYGEQHDRVGGVVSFDIRAWLLKNAVPYPESEYLQIYWAYFTWQVTPLPIWFHEGKLILNDAVDLSDYSALTLLHHYNNALHHSFRKR